MNFIIIILVIIGISFIWFFVDKFKSDNAISKEGGIRKKYSEFISLFDDFDSNNKPQILVDKNNFYQIAWSGMTMVSSISMYEIKNLLHVVYNQDANINSLKRNNISEENIKTMSKKIKLDLNWYFETNENPQNMINTIMLDLEKHQNMMYG